MCEDFVNQIAIHNSVYNEASLQFELGHYLQKELGNEYYVQYERNVSHIFDKPRGEFCKSESDIMIFKKPFRHFADENNLFYPLPSLKEEEKAITKSDEFYFIEVKYPRNRAYKKRMLHFLKDIEFCNELIKYDNRVTETICLTIIDNKYAGFFRGSFTELPYKYFREINTKNVVNKSCRVNWKHEKNISYYIVVNNR